MYLDLFMRYFGWSVALKCLVYISSDIDLYPVSINKGHIVMGDGQNDVNVIMIEENNDPTRIWTHDHITAIHQMHQILRIQSVLCFVLYGNISLYQQFSLTTQIIVRNRIKAAI